MPNDIGGGAIRPASRNGSDLLGTAWWWVMTLLSIWIAAKALSHVAAGFTHVPSIVVENGFPSPLGFKTHIAAAGFALLLGPFQLHRGIRARWPRLHRWIGRGYVAASLIGGGAAGAIALFTTSGAVAGWGFFLAAVAWLATTLLGWRAALARRFAEHERWMIRSFAVAFAAVTLRLYLPAGGVATGDFHTTYVVVAWACWVPNLIVVELWLRARDRRSARAGAASVA